MVVAVVVVAVVFAHVVVIVVSQDTRNSIPTMPNKHPQPLMSNKHCYRHRHRHRHIPWSVILYTGTYYPMTTIVACNFDRTLYHRQPPSIIADQQSSAEIGLHNTSLCFCKHHNTSVHITPSSLIVKLLHHKCYHSHVVINHHQTPSTILFKWRQSFVLQHLCLSISDQWE